MTIPPEVHLETAEYIDWLHMCQLTRTNYSMVVRACFGFSADEFIEFLARYPEAGGLRVTRARQAIEEAKR